MDEHAKEGLKVFAVMGFIIWLCLPSNGKKSVQSAEPLEVQAEKYSQFVEQNKKAIDDCAQRLKIDFLMGLLFKKKEDSKKALKEARGIDWQAFCSVTMFEKTGGVKYKESIHGRLILTDLKN